MRVYATEDDLTEWATEPIDHATALLRAASALIDDATLTAVYDVQADGMPDDPDTRDAFRDAACAQAATWAALGIDPRLGPAGATGKHTVTGKTLGKASLTYSASERSGDDLATAVTTLTPQAVSILRGALPHHWIGVRG